MFNGLWTIEFASMTNRFGRGILVINQDRLLGGDAGYYYVGTCSITGRKIAGTVNVIRYDPNSISVLGGMDHFELIISGELKNDNQFEADGSITGRPTIQIRIIGNKKEDL